MDHASLFTSGQIGLLDEVSRQAEELTGDYYHLPSFGPNRYLYEVATEQDLLPEERAPDAFAQLCRYVRSPPTPGDRQRADRYYRVCLQDASILAATTREAVRFGLPQLLLYIMTHELIHIVRFERFQHPFVTDPEARESEERRVHGLTFEILAGSEDPGMQDLLTYYRSHAIPRCL